ncbi:S-adenosyl-L-methionine-dependent methyltransferase [Coniochaeta sp. 2T2.1]|nr:S-adenosyl-L-methionine-dependent methyltransferase [Coniochaeta sp. 2T2.1]
MSSRNRLPPKPKANPISAAITSWLDALPSPVLSITEHFSKEDLLRELLASAPKRWVVYHPMVLLPAGSFRSEVWENVLYLDGEGERRRLWETVLREIGRSTGVKEGVGLSRLAANEGIPAVMKGVGEKERSGEDEKGGGDAVKKEGGNDGHAMEEEDGEEEEEAVGGEQEEENFIRAPQNLRMLHGDFGPEPTRRSRTDPTREDFERALWVVTKQNGIWQTWAPRYTMFSRGNVKEKDRLLKFHSGRTDRKVRRNAFAIDLYAGIGYFAFSYAKLGLRVLCWEINPWSVEALRRGAAMNGWSVRVARPSTFDYAGEVVWEGEDDGVGPRIVVFPESNEMAEGRLCDLDCGDFAADVVHVNCGLLPTSQPTWRDALCMVNEPEGWLHLHENVAEEDIERRRGEIQAMFDGWEGGMGGERKGVVEHVEMVKTYAPGVWHCVFDVHVTFPGADSGVEMEEMDIET